MKSQTFPDFILWSASSIAEACGKAQHQVLKHTRQGWAGGPVKYFLTLVCMKPWALFPGPHEQGMVMNSCSPRTKGHETMGRLEVQGNFLDIHSKLQTSQE